MTISKRFILNYIEMKNWGPFVDAKIKFPYDSDNNKNVTYILGINGRGKSSIFDAINTCLFGPEYAGLLNYRPLDIEKTVNKHSLYSSLRNSEINEATCEMSIELNFSQFELDMTEVEFTIYRTWTAVSSWEDESKKERLKTEISKTTFEVKEDIGGSVRWSEDWNNFKSKINFLIPSGPREFYFLDGEHVSDLFKFSNLEQTQNLALLNSEIPQLKVLIKILEKLKNRYRLRKNRAIKTNDVDKTKANNLANSIEKHQDDIELKQKELEEKRSLMKKYKIDLQNVQTIIKKSTISKEQFEKYETLKSDIKNMEIKLTNNRSKISDLLKKSAPFMCLGSKSLENVKDLLNKIEDKRIIPAPIPSNIIELISRREKCICGNYITESEKIHMRSHMESSIEQDLDGLIKRFRNRITQYIKKIPEWKSKLTALQTKIINLNKEIIKTKKELQNTSIPGIDEEELDELFHRENSLNDLIGRLEGETIDIVNKITKKNGEIESTEKDLEVLKGKDSTEHSLNKNKEDFTNEITSNFKVIIKKIEEEIIKKVQNDTSDIFKKLISNPKNWEGIKIESNWELIPIKKGGEYHEKISAGETQVMGIAFMAALSSIVRNIIPFVFDSPFGKISVKSAGTIGSTIPNLLSNQQMILFLTDTEHNNIFNSIEDKISQCYLLNMDEENRAHIVPQSLTEIREFGEI